MTTRTNAYDWGTMTRLADADCGATRSVSVARMVLKPAQRSPAHRHPNREEVVLLESGRVAHEIGGARVDHEAGTCVVIPAGVTHSSRNLADTDAVMLITYGSAARIYEPVPET